MPLAPAATNYGPVLAPPLVSLLNSAEVVKHDNFRFVAGMDIQFESCALDSTGIWLNCAEDPIPKESTGAGSVDTFEPFIVTAGDTCSTYSRADADVFKQRAVRKLNACISRRIEREVYLDFSELGNPAIASDAAVDVSEDTALQPHIALAKIEEGLGANGCGQRAMIHVTPFILNVLIHNTNGQVTQVVDPQTGVIRYYTAMGNQLVAGYGYTGADPDGEDPDSGTEWIYATAPIVIHLGPVLVTPDTMAQALSRGTNDVTFYAERAVVAAFDTSCGQLAAKVDRTESV